MKQKKWLAFEHKMIRLLKAESFLHQLQKRKILVALSGGLDSVATLVLLRRLNPLLQNEIHAVHVHHGKKSNVKFRNSSQKFSKELCEKLDVHFHLFKGNAAEFASENDLRKIRIAGYAKLKKKLNYDVLVTGHQRDDLLETRLLRLIRGTGLSGLKAMEIYSRGVFRPFLSTSKDDLKNYLNALGQVWVEDPTNQDPRYFRNWVRQVWLPLLETKQAGALKTLERSLEQILTQSGQGPQIERIDSGIKRQDFFASSAIQQRKMLLEYYSELGIKDLRHSQIEEVRRQLDNRQIIHSFIVAGAEWKVNAQQIVATMV